MFAWHNNRLHIALCTNRATSLCQLAFHQKVLAQDGPDWHLVAKCDTSVVAVFCTVMLIKQTLIGKQRAQQTDSGSKLRSI